MTSHFLIYHTQAQQAYHIPLLLAAFGEVGPRSVALQIGVKCDELGE